ncbi:acyltransferase family protein [Solilutibacter silvestris]|uniref:Putative acyltransferase n=1 Tax=Solilutibacter silvestris TaxID=1645665 RepID=A0A2K1Q1H0_9GAMM|nr:acyltransferase [Lysobacter silvestris]PNS08881.1 putative acyltransferase [Lysobacter silvestris]
MTRMPGLDLLRAIAIVWVMLFHSFIVGGLGDDWSWLSKYGWMGVDIFFVLSGYLIGSQVLQRLRDHGRLGFGDFYLRRAFRILPAFWVVLAIYVLLPSWREVDGMEPWWKFAAFIYNLDVDYNAHAAFSHAWSLCVEEHFYLLFPLLAMGLFRRNSTLLVIATIAFVLLGGIALRSAIWLHDDALKPDRNWFIEDLYYPTWCRLDGLLVGVALAAMKVFRPQWWLRLRSQANVALLIGLVGVVVSFWLHAQRDGLLANSIGWPLLALSFGLLVFAAAERDSWIGRWHAPGAGWIAAISYSLYLSHKLVMHGVSVMIDGRVHGFAAFMLYALAILAAGALLHVAAERPGLRLREFMLMKLRTTPEFRMIQ